MPKSARLDANGAVVASGQGSLPADRCLEIHRCMVRARAMEEVMIKMSKSGQGYFWIGGPGEEAFNACLGMQVLKGEGPAFDFLHFHYRNSASMIALGMPLVDGIRQMAMTRTDPNSMGRNFPGHFCRKDWNVVPVTSVIGIQWVKAPGTAIVQKRYGGQGITVVTAGDAGTHEGDFQSCLVWSSRPDNELPVLMIVMNNGWGISTSCSSQHAEKNIIDRGQPFGIPGEVVDGNDPIASWHAIARAMEYVRQERRPFLLEARVSRLYGHSSSSGALRVEGEPDAIEIFEARLVNAKVLTKADVRRVHDEAQREADDALEQALREQRPSPQDVPLHTYAASPVDQVYPGDYNGLP